MKEQLYDIVLEEKGGRDYILEIALTKQQAEAYLTKHSEQNIYMQDSTYEGEEL